MGIARLKLCLRLAGQLGYGNGQRGVCPSLATTSEGNSHYTKTN